MYNHLYPDILPINFSDYKLMGSVGEYGWAGAAKTYYWIDPKEEIIGIFLTQYMCNFSMIERFFQTLVYQTVVE